MILIATVSVNVIQPASKPSRSRAAVISKLQPPIDCKILGFPFLSHWAFTLWFQANLFFDCDDRLHSKCEEGIDRTMKVPARTNSILGRLNEKGQRDGQQSDIALD